MPSVIETVWSADAVDVDRFGLETHNEFRVSLPRDDSGSVEHVRIELFIGTDRRPCLALAAGVHGDEYDGILALQEMAREVDPRRLNGSLLIIPVVNPFAFAACERRTPDDQLDLNRAFPGNPQGSVTERLAHLVYRGFLRQAELVFTLHGASALGVLTPWIEFQDVPGDLGRTSSMLAQASGFEDLIALPRLPGRLQTAFTDLGIPLIEGEVGGRGATRAENVAYYKKRAYAVMSYSGLLPSPTASTSSQSRSRNWHLAEPVLAECDGVFLRRAQLRQSFSLGESLGSIVNGSGAVVSEVRAPLAGTIGGYRDHAGVRRGDTLFSVWTPAS